MEKEPKVNRGKSAEKLKKLSWSDLDWLETQCRSLKGDAKGGRYYSNTGDGTSQREGAKALNDHFLGVYDKHHGF